MIDRRAALGVFTLALAAACGGPEHKVVDRYFTALNAKDSQTLTLAGEWETAAAVATPTTLGAVLAQLARLQGPVLVATGYVTPPMAERLRQLNIQSIDMAGNAYLHTADKFFFITGRKPAAAAPGERARRPFRATGLRVIFALLCVPELAGAPYREIAAKAGVALGSVNIILKELEQLGFMHTGKAQGRVLVQRERLLNAWVEAYAHELRPRLKPRRFRVEKLDRCKEEDLARFDLWLGGVPVAALLTKYLRPGAVTLYGPEE